jgi:phosphocarrier protein HPr
MTGKSVTIKKDLHARPATLLIQKTQGFPSTKVWLCKENKKIQTNSLIAILSLGLKKDTVITLEVEGEKEEEVLEILADFIEKELESA